MATAKLQDVQVSKAKPKTKAYKLSDGKGLVLYVTPAGGKYWRWRYYFQGRERIMSLGDYQAMSLSDARAEHQALVRILKGGRDPIEVRQEELKAAADLKPNPPVSAAVKLQPNYPDNSFGAVESEWFAHWSEDRDAEYAEQMKSRLENDVMPVLGNRLIREVEAPEVVEAVKAIDARGAHELARKALRTISQIFRYAIAHGYAGRNPARDIQPSDIFRAVRSTNHPRVHERSFPKLLSDIEDYSGREVTVIAMRIMAHTFLRTTELVEAPWAEIDLVKARWEIPAVRMKMDSPHIVPLSRQVVAELRKLQQITQNEKWVFPSDWDQNECMSTGTISGALKRMGYRGIMTGHGFRGIASTILHERGYDDAHIEIQLAHLKRSKNKTGAAYDYAKYLVPRTKMMQDWSDYLDEQLIKEKRVA
jgi:integrase